MPISNIIISYHSDRIREGLTIPTPSGIVEDEMLFLSKGNLTSRLLFFKTKIMKTMSTKRWEFTKIKSDYYAMNSPYDEAMALWVLHFYDNKKCLKDDKDDDTISNGKSKRVRGDSVHSIHVFSQYLKQIQNLRSKYKEEISIRNEDFRRHMLKELNERASHSAIKVYDEDEKDSEFNIPDASEYMTEGWDV